MSGKTLRLGLVGVKGINWWMYRPAILECAAAELVAGCDPDEGAAANFTKEVGKPVFASLKEMAEAVELDGAMIGTPNHIHLRNIREAAELGLNMCVTKPMTNTVADSIEAIRLCEEAGVVLATGHEYRWRPVVRALRERVAAGECGAISLVQAHMGHKGGLGKLTDGTNWRSRAGNVPGGCANMLGTHCFDVVNALLGKPVAVTACHRKLISPAPLDDTTCAIVEYESPGVGVASSSYASSQSDWVRVYGTEANLLAHTRAEKLFLEKDGKVTELHAPDHPTSGVAVVEMFARAVREGAAPETGGPEGLNSVAVLEASILSSQRGQRILIEDVTNA